MTQEEKAKAYDEALKRARFYHGNCPSEPEREKLERMFPVLRESEDERIRKMLLEKIHQWHEVALSGKVQQDIDDSLKAIGWLEKQGHQETLCDAWSEEDERLKHSCIAHIEDELEKIGNDKYGHSEIISDLKESCRERIEWLKSLKERIKGE